MRGAALSSWKLRRPSSHSQLSLTSGLRLGNTRKIAPSRWSILTVHPVEHPPQTESVACKNHTRHLNLKSREVSAPTGQMSTTFPEYGLSSGLSSNVPIAT